MAAADAFDLWSPEYIDEVLADPPSWGNLVRLAQLVHDTDLEQLMGGLALMLR